MRREGYVFRREGRHLVPLSEEADAAVRRIRNGGDVFVSLHVDAPPALVRRWHAMIGEAVQHTRFGSREALADAVKIQAGFVTFFTGGDGVLRYHSISTTEMDGIQLSDLVERGGALIAQLIGVEPEIFQREAAARLGAR